jgi:L-serine dehydratase
MISILDLFRIGIGPSSSHTVGPMRIAKRFLDDLFARGQLADVTRVRVELQGSLALTGAGHGSPTAVILGLMGQEPETVDPDQVPAMICEVQDAGSILLLGTHRIDFNPTTDIELACHVLSKLHPNSMALRAFDGGGTTIAEAEYYSTGGGFVATRKQLESPAEDDLIAGVAQARLPFGSAEELLSICNDKNMAIADVILANEACHRPEQATLHGIDQVVVAMFGCIDRGLSSEGILPGSLAVRRRAPELWTRLQSQPMANEAERIFDWLNVFAMAVNEENAAGGRVVTAPTNGAAGIIPAVLRHYCDGEADSTQKARLFVLTAGGIGLLYKQRASISGAEMGCQGEVGVACSMAAGGLAAVWGGTAEQITTAAEIGMEHNLGLTCDPVGGLVQIPCIERNAVGAVKAVNAARLALHSFETPKVSLDQVIETMRQTGLDMSSKYKETSLGGLAVNVVAC